MSVVDGKTICQIALVVKDVEATAKRYADLFGVPTPEVFLVPPYEEAKTTYMGEPTPTRAKLAVFDLGQVVLELTEPDQHPSSWKAHLDAFGEGVHHIAFMTKSRDEVKNYFQSLGINERHYGEYHGGNYTVFDAAALFGVKIQVKEE